MLSRTFHNSVRQTLRAAPIRPFSSSTLRAVAVGDKIPSVPLFENSPGNEFDLASEVASKKAVIVGIPGAFSPACSASHVPGYIKNIRAFNDKGYTGIYIVSVNDPFVMKAFGENLLEHNVGTNQLKFLSDPRAEFSKALDVTFDATKVFGDVRSKRYAILVDNGKVTHAFVEPDNTSIDVSAAEKVLDAN